MTRERRVLLTILVSLGIVSLLVVSISAGVDRLAATSSRLALYKKEFKKVMSERENARNASPELVAKLKQQVQQERAHYYSQGEMDPYRFAAIVQRVLDRDGVTVRQFRTTEGKSGTLLQYTVEGRPNTIVRFMYDVSRSDKYWIVPYLHLQSVSGKETLSCDFQIGYVVSKHEKAK